MTHKRVILLYKKYIEVNKKKINVPVEIWANKKNRFLEFLLWHNRVGSVSEVPGDRFDPWPSVVGWGIRHCRSCRVAHSYALDSIPGLGVPYAAGC